MARKAKKHTLDLSDDLVNEAEYDKQAGYSGFLQIVRENAAYGLQGWAENFAEARDDVRFFRGGKYQWEQKAYEKRMLSDRPALTFNDLPQYVDQVLGDQRQNRPSIHIAPSDDAGAGIEVGNVAGTSTYKMAEVYEGLIRNIEYSSNAETHYDVAGQHAVEAGFGWLRVLTTYANPKSFDLDIRIKSIANRWSVVMDPDAQEPDYSDANYAFIFDEMPRHQFDKLYPNAAIGNLNERDAKIWGGKTKVSVAEYYERYAVQRELLLLSSGEIVWRDEVKDVLDDLLEKGVTVERQRLVDTFKVRWWKVTANSVLRGPIDIPCSMIPIAPVLGKELNIDGISYYRGMIRNAKDPKRADNFWMTAATERVALSPKAPWVLTAKQIEGHETEWATANQGTPSVLVYNSDPAANGMPKRQDPATMPAAELQVAAHMTDKVKSTIGMYDASIGAQSNETSGIAITARQRKSDIGAFAFSDNQNRSIAHVGRILVEMIPAIYDTARTVRIRHVNGKGDWIKINTVVRDDKTGKDVVIHDMALGSYDVTVKAGPSYTTQRAEASAALLEFVRVVPGVAPIIVDKIADVMDWPDADEITKRLRYTIPGHMLTEEEREGMEEQPPEEPTPEQAVAAKQAEADMANAEAETTMAQAKSEEAQAKIAEIQARGVENAFMADVAKLIEETLTQVIGDHMKTVDHKED